jgi:hypothetical protein
MRKARTIACVAVAGAVFSGCGGGVLSAQEPSTTGDGGDAAAMMMMTAAQIAADGVISAQVDLPPGMSGSTSVYILKGPNGFLRSANLSFSGSQPIAFAIDEVPPASGYSLEVAVGVPDGSETCSGSAMFDIAGMSTTFVTLFAQCSPQAEAD